MNKKFVVIGLGDFGMSVAVNLASKGADVIAIDQDMEVVEQVKDKVVYAAKLDSTDEKALKSLGIDNVDAAIISIGTNFEDTVLSSVLLLQMGIKKVVARASSKIQEKVLKKLGVHQVITPEFEIAARVANNLIHEDIIDYISLDENYNIIQILTPKIFIGKTLQEIDLRIKYNLNLITIKRQFKTKNEDTGEEVSKERIYGVPTSSTVIEENDILIVLGRDKDIRKIVD